LDPRKRDDLQRFRDNLDDQYVARQKDEAWIMREGMIGREIGRIDIR